MAKVQNKKAASAGKGRVDKEKLQNIKVNPASLKDIKPLTKKEQRQRAKKKK